MVGVEDLSEVGITSQTPIWLYGSIGQFIDMFEKGGFSVKKVARYVENNADSLPSADCFTDIHAETNQIFRNTTCLCEFFSTAGDTHTAWKRHKPNQVAFRTSVNRLCEALSEDRFEVHVVPVQNYCQLSTVSINPESSTPSKVSISDFVSQFSYKDENHGQEQAIRLVGVRNQGINNDSYFDLRKVGLTKLREREVLSADLDSLIDKVVVSPFAGGWVADLLQEYVKDDFDIDDFVNRSSIDLD